MHKKKELRAHQKADGMLLLFMDFRKTHGLSQEKMARLLNMERSYISLIEQGRRPMTDEVVSRFLRVQTELLAKERPVALDQEDVVRDSHVGEKLRAKWVARENELIYRLSKIQKRIESLPDWKQHSIKMENLGHLVKHMSADKPVTDFFKNHHDILSRTTPLKLQQMKIELEFESELLKLETELIKKYLAEPAQD